MYLIFCYSFSNLLWNGADEGPCICVFALDVLLLYLAGNLAF